jgi:hypothetical protein
MLAMLRLPTLSSNVKNAFIFLILLFSNLSVFAHDWNPEDEIPEVTHIGSVTAEAREQADLMRADLVKQLRYWKEIGLPNPPDLEAVIHLGDVEHVRLTDIVAQLNPSIQNIKAHVAEQYRALQKSELAYALSDLVQMINKSFNKNIIAEELLDAFFDRYAFFRYGFSVNNFAYRIAKNSPMSECDIGSFTVFQDNAYYGRFPKINLNEILFPLSDDVKGRAINLLKIINDKKFQELNENPTGVFSRRLVFLPRSTQSKTDWNLLTIRDLSVSRHELGHHLSATYRGDLKPVHLLTEEVIADYIASAVSEDPKIGEFFAKASGEIAKRFKNEKDRDLDSFKREFVFERMGQKGLLRDLSQATSLDQVDRNIIIANPYDAGHPLRYFLWTLRHSSGVDKAKIDQVLMKALQENSLLPFAISPRASFAIHFRSGLRQLLDKFQVWVLSFKEKQLPKDVRNKLLQEAEEITQRNFHKNMSPEIERDLRDMERDPAAKKRLVKAYNGSIKKAFNKLENAWLEDNLDPEKLFSIEKNWALKKRNREEALKLLQVKKALAGNPRRKPISSDYVIPEFLRSFFRVALREYPELEGLILENASKITNSKAQIVVLANGDKEIVFIPNHLLSFMAISKLKKHLEKLAVLRKDLSLLDAEIDKIKGDDSREETKKSYLKVKAQLNANYANSLDRILEYERTGSLRRLSLPFLRQRVAQKVAKVTGFGLQLVAKALSKFAKKPAEKICGTDLLP